MSSRLVKKISDQGPVPEATSVQEPSHVFPATFAQRRLWFLQELEPNQISYISTIARRLSGPLNADAISFAINRIVERHDTMRTSFHAEAGEPVQVVSPYKQFEIVPEDLSHTQDPSAVAHEIAVLEANTPFDLTARNLFRCRLLRLSLEEHILLFTTHHIVFDGWSKGVWTREFSAFYREYISGEKARVGEIQIQYGDFAAWQQEHLAGKALDDQLAFWVNALEGAPTLLTLPIDRPRTRGGSPDAGYVPFTMSKTLTLQLRKLAAETNSTLFMVALTSFYVFLSRYSGVEDILVGTPIANRERLELEPLIGLFNNMLVMRGNVKPDASFLANLAEVRRFTLDAYAHQDMPFEKLVEHLQPERNLTHTPLFQVMFLVHNTPREAANLPGLKVSAAANGRFKTKADFSLSIVDAPEFLRGTIEYSASLFDQSTVERMLSHYLHLLEGIVSNPELAVGEVGLLSSGDVQQLVVDWNDTAADYPRSQCVHELFSRRAAAQPGSIAVLFGNEHLSYGDLEDRSNRLAHHLQSMGVARGQRVGVYLDRSLDLIVSLLAVMKAGAAYVPLDPSYPAKRVEMILHDAEVACLITVSGLRHRLDHRGPTVLLDAQASAIAGRPATPVAGSVTPDDLLYVTFTSGSTGRPKGVEIPHRALVNVVFSMTKELNIGAADVFPAITSIGFDISAAELMVPLLTGGTLALGESYLAGNGEALAAFLSRNRATVIHATPTTWILLLDAGFNTAGLKRCIGGEALSQGLFERLMATAPGTPLFNFYGPTETTVWSTAHRFTSAEETIVVGRPLANTQVYVLDRKDQVCPIGVVGEIHIAGDGVARGYYGREDLTSEKFVPNPFNSDPASRMYKTGDLGRWCVDGTIEHMGRIDHQVKIRGFRIELGEIETALTRQPDIREAVVITREDVPGDKRLVAYITSTSKIDRANLRAQLQETLPDYMVPAAFVTLERLPLTPNGKIDRKALPAPDAHSITESNGQPPATRMEVLIAEIWKGILKISVVNRDDDFFRLGGHSMLAAAMIGKLSESLGYRVRLASLFESPTLGALAAAAERQGREHHQLSTIVPIRKSGTTPALFCVSRPNVNALGFIFLSRALSPDIPVYGLQAYTENDGSIAPFTQQEYEEKATEYIAAMREIQPEGPYFLIGYCEGAHIAFEMARQLEAMSLEVGGLFILDVWPIENTIDRKRFLFRGYSRVIQRFAKSSNRDRLAIILRKQRVLSARTGENGRKLPMQPLDRERRKILDKLLAERYWPGKDFKPTMYNRDVVVFKVPSQPFYQIKDDSLGWRARVRGDVAVIPVPGTHRSILREPAVSVLARELGTRIEAYLTRKNNAQASE